MRGTRETAIDTVDMSLSDHDAGPALGTAGRAAPNRALRQIDGTLWGIPADARPGARLAGAQGPIDRSFGTTWPGAGRAMSRTAAGKRVAGAELRRGLEARRVVKGWR